MENPSEVEVAQKLKELEILEDHKLISFDVENLSIDTNKRNTEHFEGIVRRKWKDGLGTGNQLSTILSEVFIKHLEEKYIKTFCRSMIARMYLSNM